jgi:hypothetical protein
LFKTELTVTLAAALAAALACGGGSGPREAPAPVSGFGMLSGKTTLVLPVQYARRVPGGWPGGAANAKQAMRSADAEIGFALEEYSGRAIWVMPERQIEVLRRQPSIRGVDPYLLSADYLRRQGGDARWFRDPLFGEVRKLAALFDARYAVWPLELIHVEDAEGDGVRLAIRGFLLDTRSGAVLWYGLVTGGEQAPDTPGALAEVAQNFARVVSP